MSFKRDNGGIKLHRPVLAENYDVHLVVSKNI